MNAAMGYFQNNFVLVFSEECCHTVHVLSLSSTVTAHIILCLSSLLAVVVDKYNQ